jgi:predicted peroxiredoxin
VSKILVHVTCGPEQPTKAALAFLVAKAAIDDGHEVSLFLAGDGCRSFATRRWTRYRPLARAA